MPNQHDRIVIRGARVHNLKNISLKIPKNKLIVVTGLSGSGKSSLAFDTIYAEGQRRYAESLSAYARQFMEIRDQPDVDEIQGLSPTIAIDQRASFQNPRSTVGTITEIYDYLRILFARFGLLRCPDCQETAESRSPGQIVEIIRQMARQKHALRVLAPIVRLEKKSISELEEIVNKSPYKLFRFDNRYFTKNEFAVTKHREEILHNLEVVVAEITTERLGNLPFSVDTALDLGNGLIIVDHFKENSNGARNKNPVPESASSQLVDARRYGAGFYYSTKLRCPKCGRRFPTLEPRTFSFNSPAGACPRCSGLGITLEVDPELVIPNPRLTLAQGAIQPWMRITGNQNWYLQLLQAVAQAHGFSMDLPVELLSPKIMEKLLRGTGSAVYAVDGKEIIFEGVMENLAKRHRETTSDYVRKEIEEYMIEKTCSLCQGQRLNKEALAVTFAKKTIADIVNLTVEGAISFFSMLKSQELGVKQAAAEPLFKEILKRLRDLTRVGLDYLTLERSMLTLSGGEAQRVRLSTQLSSGLSGVIYILDEPSVGLHQRDIEKLINTLKSLRDLGNTVMVVEHDEIMMRQADYIIDIGPGAGVYGGEVVAAGTLSEILKNKKSLTGLYLSGRLQILLTKKTREKNNKFLTVKKAAGFNLKNIDVKIPLGRLVCITGVSGSGKSTLIIETLSKALLKRFYRAKAEPAKHGAIIGYENIDKVISIDQSPIGRTPRSNPATYTSVFTAIRDLFTEVPEAKMRGYDAGKFSFNVKGGGRCEACGGEGYVRIPMQFLAEVFTECNVCAGKRYNSEALEIHYKGKNIADILSMTVEEAKNFFSDQIYIAEKLQVLSEVGLGYIHLGQPATNLSGGEAQRVKLATELARRSTGKTLYILDEPTTGLHFEDIKQLLQVLEQLVAKGNTVLIIEHNLEVIKNADWIIDLGPGGGDKGGQIVAEGQPKEIVKIKASLTGQYLKPLL